MKKTLAALVLLGVALFAAPTHAAQILIDDFRDANHFPLPQSQTGWAIPLFTQANPFIMEHENDVNPVGTILGGQRDTMINVVTTPKGVSANGVIGDVDEEDPGTEGAFEFGSSATATVIGILEYDGVDFLPQTTNLTNALGLGAINLTATGNNSFALVFRSVDPAPAETGVSIRIEVTSAGGDASFDGIIPESGTEFTYNVPFASFTSQAPLSAATSIRFIFNDGGSPDAAVDFNLRSIAAVPEPTTVVSACMGVALVGVSVWRRQRKTATT
jgi:hypothetical protein